MSGDEGRKALTRPLPVRVARCSPPAARPPATQVFLTTGGAIMKKLLILAAVGEGVTGLLLLVDPSLVVRLLAGVEITHIALVLSRLYGVSLIALGIACWPGNAPRREFYAMSTYCTVATLYLTYMGFSGLQGILMWPAVAVHAALSILLAWAWRKEQSFPAVGT